MSREGALRAALQELVTAVEGGDWTEIDLAVEIAGMELKPYAAAAEGALMPESSDTPALLRRQAG